jgi:hypothetical protein
MVLYSSSADAKIGAPLLIEHFLTDAQTGHFTEEFISVAQIPKTSASGNAAEVPILSILGRHPDRRPLSLAAVGRFSLMSC